MLKRAFALALLTIPLFGEEESCHSDCNRGFYSCAPDPEEIPAKDCQPKEPCFSACECHEGPSIGIATIRHREPGGIGYREGYTTVDLFYLIDSGNWFPFIDLRGHGFNDGKPAYNIGGGVRYLSPCCNFASGLNIYYDYRDAEHTNFHALGAGIELLWSRWSLGLNGYAPVNRHKKSYRTGFSGFKGNTARFFKKYETAMSGGDISLTWELFRYLPMTQCPHGDGSIVGDVIFGAYYFVGDFGETAAGGLLRFRITAARRFFAEGQISYDNQFNWRGQGEAGLRFTFGPPVKRTNRLISECFDLIALEEKLAEKPNRFEMIVTTNHKKKGKARNALTKELQRFIFVSPNGGSDGSFESPFATVNQALAIAGPNDLIYLLAGDGTAIQSTGPLTLQNGQTLLGSGTSFPMRTSFGMATLPKQSKQLPILATGAAASFISLASDNTIAGIDFNIDQAITTLVFGDVTRNFDFLFNRVALAGGSLSFASIRIDDFLGKHRLVGNHFVDLDVTVGVNIESISAGLTDIFAFGNRSTMSPASSSAHFVFRSEDISRYIVENNTSFRGEIGVATIHRDGASTSLIRGNRYVGGDSSFSSGNLIGDGVAFVKGNQIDGSSALAGNGVVITGPDMNAKVFVNEMIGDLPAVILLGPLNAVQSPNLKTSGLEAINTGTVAVDESSGPVFFIPFE